MEKLKNIYTTGEFARAIGTTKDTLFHYDRIGLFSPEYTGGNGYRYYSQRQFWVFTDIQSLRNVGMSLSDIKRYMSDRSLSSYAELLRNQIITTKNEIHYLQDILNDLEASLTYANEAIASSDEFSVVYCESKYGIRTRSSDEAFGKDFLDFWKRIHDSEYFISNILNSAVSIDKITSPAYTYDYLYAEINGESQNEADIVRKEGLYLTGYHHGPDDLIYETYKRMFSFAEEKGITLGSMAFEEYLAYEIAVTNDTDKVTKLYLEVI